VQKAVPDGKKSQKPVSKGKEKKLQRQQVGAGVLA
jgi:hypothetical protein